MIYRAPRYAFVLCFQVVLSSHRVAFWKDEMQTKMCVCKRERGRWERWERKCALIGCFRELPKSPE